MIVAKIIIKRVFGVVKQYIMSLVESKSSNIQIDSFIIEHLQSIRFLILTWYSLEPSFTTVYEVVSGLRGHVQIWVIFIRKTEIDIACEHMNTRRSKERRDQK